MILCLRQVKVLFSTCVDKSRIASHSKVIQRLGGQVVDGDASDFTHFVSLPPRTGQSKKDKEDRGFKKSINSLIALAAGMFLIYHTLLLKLQLPCFIAWTASCSCLCTPLLLMMVKMISTCAFGVLLTRSTACCIVCFLHITCCLCTGFGSTHMYDSLCDLCTSRVASRSHY